MQIITDSAALLSRQEGITMGVDVIPLSVIVNGRSYLDLEELDGPSLIEIINQGHFPTTSQPSVGETLEVFQKYAHEEILYITMADGISGTYQNARAARKMMECPDAIHILNSRTLCGPQRYLVEKAIVLAPVSYTHLQLLDIGHIIAVFIAVDHNKGHGIRLLHQVFQLIFLIVGINRHQGLSLIHI